MNITVKYSAQLKQSLGKELETLEMAESSTLQKAIEQLARKHGEAFSSFLFDPNGSFSQSVLLVVNGEQVFWSDNTELKNGDVVDLMAPMSGG